MIQLVIVKTAKNYNSKEGYCLIAEDSNKYFKTLKQAKKWLDQEYNCKRDKMYTDVKNKKPRHIGYVYSFRNADYSHSPIDKWLQRDWVGFREVKQFYFK